MKQFKINEEQIRFLANILGEFPAKNVLGTFDLLRTLPEIFEEESKATTDNSGDNK